MSLMMFISTQVSHLFDNEGTVAFAMFMAIWGESFIWPCATFSLVFPVCCDFVFNCSSLHVFSHCVPGTVEETQSHICFAVEGL